MKKMIGLLGMSFLMLASCSSDDDNSADSSSRSMNTINIINGKMIFLKKSIFTDTDGSHKTLNFSYTNYNKLAKVVSSDGYVGTVSYSGNLITKFDLKLANNTVVQSKRYIYDANHKLTSYTTTVPTSNTGEKEVYVYNTNGTISITHYIGTATSQTQPAGTGSVTFQNGEVKQIQTTYGPNRTYTFDTKLNPFKNVIGFDKIAIANDFTIGIVHNIASEIKTQNGTTHTTAVQYNYNNNYYPVSSTQNYDGEITSMQYFY